MSVHRGRWLRRGLLVVVVGATAALIGWSLVADGKTPVAVVSGALAALATMFVPPLLAALRPARTAHKGGPDSSRVFGAVPRVAWHFQNRPAEVRALRRALKGQGRAALVALAGQRGVGKSQLAAAYARQCAEDGYDLVAWLNAEGGPTAELALLAEHVGLRSGADQMPHELATAVTRWLSEGRRGRQLVVFDNVDDPDDVAPYLPGPGGATVLITSNRQEFAAMPGVAVVPVGLFSSEQGRRFLREATGLADSPDAGEVGEQLGWLPLGLAQAAAYIVRNKLAYRRYLEALDGQSLDATLRRQAGTDHPGVLKATQLSVAGLVADDPSGDSVRLLTVLALLSADGISRELLVAGADALGLAGGVGRALDLLAGASLVTLGGAVEDERGRDRVVVAVHRLTARVIRHLATGADTTPPLADAVAAATEMLDRLTDHLPYAQVAQRRAEVDELVAHILTLHGHVAEPSPLLLIQLLWAARALRSAGDVARALALSERLLTDRERVLGADHPDTLIARSDLALTYETTGRVELAVVLLEQVLADSERALGPDHPDTLTSRNDLATAYVSVGRTAEAIPLHEQTLADRERVLGPDHRGTLTSRNNLAHAYASAGRMTEALTLHEQVLADSERILGPDHPDTLISRSNVAYVYVATGRAAQVIPLHEQTLAERERILGNDHPDTLTSRNNLAHAYMSAGRITDAIALHEHTLAERERILGNDHPDTLTSRNNLAHAYTSAGRTAQGITLYEQTLAECERTLGPEHSATRTVRANLAAARATTRG
ncbi:tetratricopeptide repeat protein [Micromonospora sp. RP3T]|uniref:tetratricopeptide repeat protein n=1 Tax=Micromonospora sp. RP3T TaxID=2135446 RepID=UPI0011B273A7|nr:tetratricopeptide repeat protein [Micromonospora sp. RP3T]